MTGLVHPPRSCSGCGKSQWYIVTWKQFSCCTNRLYKFVTNNTWIQKAKVKQNFSWYCLRSYFTRERPLSLCYLLTLSHVSLPIDDNLQMKLVFLSHPTSSSQQVSTLSPVVWDVMLSASVAPFVGQSSTFRDNCVGLRDDSGQWSQSPNMSLFSGEYSWLCEEVG
jgi:hypothetical protein